MRLLQTWASVFAGRLPVPTGTWQRIDDSFAGCLLAVRSTETGYSGVCIYVPPSLRRFGWKVGDQKWRGLQPGWRGYRGEELFRVHSLQSSDSTSVGYGGVILRFQNANRLIAQPTEATRRTSVWVRTATECPQSVVHPAAHPAVTGDATHHAHQPLGGDQ